ncbi:hypothetical protein ANCDUO_07147 [Ancylostoma duodenale]|uniref:Uncharacterized protein n=1 Tax=Ancylostoma duodenale TaxID=51022 RepID=A0A0C2GMQ7_9BILA|nr:hypothetical protein ANCDUO_07147 [Ancylostoma duodenale]
MDGGACIRCPLEERAHEVVEASPGRGDLPACKEKTQWRTRDHLGLRDLRGNLDLPARKDLLANLAILGNLQLLKLGSRDRQGLQDQWENAD